MSAGPSDLLPWAIALVCYIEAGQRALAAIMAHAGLQDADLWNKRGSLSEEAARVSILLLALSLWPVVLAAGRVLSRMEPAQ